MQALGICCRPDEIGKAFEKLYTENKNGAVMQVIKKKDGTVRADYVTHEWKA